MKRIMIAAGALAFAGSAAVAGGIDRSGQGIGALFETGQFTELSFGSVSPTISGTDAAAQPTGNVAADYFQVGFSYKYDVNEKLSFALIIDQPFGADLLYGPTSPVLGGTSAAADSIAVSGYLRYKFSDAFSVHGGLRAQRASAAIGLQGIAYGGLSGYNVDLGSDTALGYSVGAAFEKPEIALLVALTYHSRITHDFETVERVGLAQVSAPGAMTEVNTPQSVNLDFQTGIAANTLLFGQVRWVDWSSFTVTPAFFGGATGGASLVDLEDTVTYTLGVGRKFSDAWSGSLSMTYEEQLDPLVSPLAPTNGKLGATLAGIYTHENMKVTVGVNYTKIGDASPATSGTSRASFSGNSALGVGVRVGFTF